MAGSPCCSHNHEVALIFLLESRTGSRKGKSSTLPCGRNCEGRGDKARSLSSGTQLHDEKPVLALSASLCGLLALVSSSMQWDNSLLS